MLESLRPMLTASRLQDPPEKIRFGDGRWVPSSGWVRRRRARKQNHSNRPRLEPAKIGVTLETYSHVTADLHSDAAEKVAGLVFRP
jgi:hypothetical protein